MANDSPDSKNKISNSSDQTAFWGSVLTQLEMTMTQATFTWFHGSRAVLDGNNLTVHAATDAARQWLENRLHPNIKRQAEFIHGAPLTITYTANGSTQPGEQEGLNTEGPPPASPPEPEPAGVAAEALAHFDHRRKFYSKHPQYVSLFWVGYLGTDTITVWQWLRDQHGVSADFWTAPADYEIKQIMDSTGVSRQKLMGVPRGCIEFDRALLEQGRQLAQCCGRYKPLPGPWPHTTRPVEGWPEGRPTCRHWVPGALELLQEEGLALWRKRGTTRGAIIRIQAYQYPPILTPRQAGLLPARTQIEHLDYLRNKLDVDVAEWEQIKDYSLMAAWFERTGLEMDLPDSGVFSAIAQNKFFFVPDVCI